MLAALQQHGVDIRFTETPDQTWGNWVMNLAPLALLGALWFIMIGRMNKAGQNRPNPPNSNLPT